MMKLLPAGLLLIIAFNSCSPVYRCGETAEKVSGSKRLKNVVTERDSLCTSLAAEQSKTAQLVSDTTNAGKQIRDLQARYENVSNTSVTQAGELRNREKALEELQRIISRQDSANKRLNDILKNALLGFNPDELSVEIRNGKVYVSLSEKLLFKSGSAAVESKGKEALKAVADVLNKNQDINILVEGHTDSIPIRTVLYKDNWDLSVARATSIVRILTADYTVTPERVTASGKGEFFPKASNSTAEGRATNRRTEIILSPKLDEVMNLISEGAQTQ